jgi:hypothetical protein
LPPSGSERRPSAESRCGVPHLGERERGVARVGRDVGPAGECRRIGRGDGCRRKVLEVGLALRDRERLLEQRFDTIQTVLRASSPPRYSRPAVGSNVDSFKDEIHHRESSPCRDRGLPP